MKLTIGTARLQATLNKAVKGAGCNPNYPMTSLIVIQLKDGTFTLTTVGSDKSTYLSMIEQDVVGDEFYVAVNVELFSKLVSRMTCDEVTLEVTDNHLDVIGNGKYQIEIAVEDDGSFSKIPNPIGSFNKENKIGVVDSSTITTTLTSVKPALATKMDYPWFTCYYVKDSIMATDIYMVTDYANGFLDDARLIRSDIMDLLGLLTGEISVYSDRDKLLFEAENGSVYGATSSGIENYSVTELKALINQKFKFSCSIGKASLLKLLDRIALFVGEYDNGEITLNFGADSLEVTSRYATETIQYMNNENAGEFVCNIDVTQLITQVKAQTDSEITIEYGEDNAIKLIDGNIISAICLME